MSGPRGAALDQVANIYLFARHTNAGQQFFQELAGCADERPALAVFVEARPFTDEYDIGAGRAFAGNRVVSPLMELTQCARADRFLKLLKRHLVDVGHASLLRESCVTILVHLRDFV